MEWTSSQKEAINTKNKSLLLNAGAGCGKTTVLTNRILNLMLKEKISIENFLVVTFTNNAASQMKDKIRDMLYKNIEKNEQFIYEQINALENCNISTLHSFCIETIRKYYHIVDIDPSFNIMDEVNMDMLKREVLNNLFEKMYEDDNKDFINMAILYSKNNNDETFKNELLNIYSFIYNNPSPFEFLKENIKKYEMGDVNIYLNIIKNDIIIKLKASLCYLNNAYKRACEIHLNEKSTDLLEGNINLVKTAIELVKTEDISILKEFDSKLPTFRMPKDIDETDSVYIKDNRKAGLDIYKKILANPFFDKEYYEDLSKKIAPYLNTIHETLSLYDEMLKEEKKKKGVLDFGDTEHLTLKILENEEALNEIKDNFKYVFVDEYQDINTIQEKIITKIADEDNLFTVGDIKQSIYRFRQANPSIFLKRYKEYNNLKDEKNKCIYMQDNFRSNKNIIKAINTIFLNLMNENIGGIEYKDNQELIAGKDSFKNNKIEINIIDKEKKAETYEDEISDLRNEEKEATFVANRVLALLKEKIYDGDLKEERFIRLSDICILSRSANTRLNVIKDVFNKFNIPLNTPSETNFYTSYEINTITSLLNLINNFKDDINLLSVMRSPLYNFSMDELIEIKLSSKEKYFYKCILNYEKSELKNDETLNKIKAMLYDLNMWYEKSNYMALNDLITDIYVKTNFLEFVLALPYGSARKENLKTFVNLSKNYESFSSDGLYGFLNFIEYNKSNAQSVESNNSINDECVNYMTIHKSKGLEFPIVILYSAGSQFKKQGANSFLLNKDLGIGMEYVKDNYFINSIQKKAISITEKREELSEELRLLYVALTRAKEKVIVTGTSKKNLDTLLSLLDTKIDDYQILNSLSFLEWMLLGCNLKKENLSNDLFEVNIIDKTLLPKEREIQKNNTSLETIPQIKQHLNYKYPYIDTLIPMKLSVSSMREEENIRIGKNTIDLISPSFEKEEDELSLAQKGSLIHFILEITNLEKIKKADDLEKEINNQIDIFISQGRIEEKDKKYIDTDILSSFYKSKIGEEILNSDNVLRELPFTLSVYAKELNKDYEESDEEVLVQGIIDLLYTNKEGNYILVDYKTSHYKDEKNKKRLIEHYTFQLQYYKKAVEKITKREVVNSYIYFLNNKEAVEVI